MSDEKVYDQYGTEIGIGDLVVTDGRVGMVSKFNAHSAPNVRVHSTKKVYAYEWGAPDIPKKGTRTKRDERGYPIRKEGSQYSWDWETEEYEYFEKDWRVVGEEPYTYTVVRQNTSGLTVLRKTDGTVPSPFLDAIEKHKLVFPDKESDSE